MGKLWIAMGLLATTTCSLAQSGAVIPQGGAGHASEASCVILKRMGPADQVTSKLYSFGIRGKQFQYIEGKLPEGFPFHGRLTDHDVRNLQSRGAEVLILESHYTTEDLKAARADCRGETGKTPNQSEPKSGDSNSAASESTGGSKASEATQKNETPAVSAASSAKLSLSSLPGGADIEVDGSFLGNTPSDVQLPEGEHTVVIKKAGFKEWERKIKLTAGSSVHLNAELEPGAPPPAASSDQKQ